MKRILIAVSLGLFLVMAGCGDEQGKPNAPDAGEYVPNQIIVLFVNTVTEKEIQGLIDQVGATVLTSDPYFPFYLLELPDDLSVEDAQVVLDASPLTETVLPDYIMSVSSVSNETDF